MVTTVHYIVTTLYSLSQPLLTLKTNSFQSPVPTSPAITHHTPSQQPAVSHSCAECTLTSEGSSKTVFILECCLHPYLHTPLPTLGWGPLAHVCVLST